MPEQLFERLKELRHRVRFVLWVYGLSCVIVAFFLSTLLAGSLDWLWHLDESGTRVLLGLGVLGVSGWVAWRYLWVPVSTELSDVELASRIERYNPSFNDSLSSTVEFLKSQQDERVGSPALQREVIESTLKRLDEVSVEGLIETRPVQKVGWWAVATCVLVGLVVGLNQAEAATAMNRLLFPFSPVPWPKDVELRFVDKDLQPLEATSEGALTVVQGRTLELFVENLRGNLPEDLALVSRRASGSVTSEPMRQTTLRDDDGNARQIGGATLHVTSGPLFFWARGGDGETLPLQVDVVPPPKVESLRVRVIPPAYTKKPERELPENVGHVEATVGTRVSIQVRVNKPLRSAMLNRRKASPQRLKVSEAGLSVSGTMKLDRPGSSSWWLTLRDRQGFENPEAPRYDLRAIPDGAPSVTIEVPETDLLVTPVAKIPFRVLVRDDLGVRSAELVYESSAAGQGSRREAVSPESGAAGSTGSEESKNAGLRRPAAPESDAPGSERPANAREVDSGSGNGSDDGVLELVKQPEAGGDPQPVPREAGRGPEREQFDASGRSDGHGAGNGATGPPRGADSGRMELFQLEDPAADRPEQIRPELTWDLEPHDWKPGTRIEVVAEARDWYDLDDEHVGRSNRRILTIVSPEEKQSELADRQAALLLDLQRAAKTQETAHQYLKELQLQVEETGTLRPEDLDLLKRVELDQRQLQDRLTEGDDSLEHEARSIRQEREANQIEDADSDALLKALAGELSFLRTGPLPKIEQKLTETRKLNATKSESDRERERDMKDALETAAANQEQAIRSLESVLEDLSQWRNRRNLNAEMRSMTGRQQELSEEAGKVGQKTLTRSLAELTDQERADLARLAARQQQMADRVEEFSKQMKEAVETAKDTQPDVDRAFEEAMKTVKEAALTGDMRQAARNLQRNRVGDAVQTQQQVVETMRKIQNQLDQREVTDTETLIKQLDEARQDLSAARKRQDTLMQKAADAAQIKDPAEREQQLEKLRREQEQLRHQIEETLRRLRRLQSPSADAAGRAAQRMQDAGQSLESGDSGGAQEQMQEALDDLEQAEREAARDQKQAEEQLAREQLEKLESRLQSLHDRQKVAVAETKRLQLELETAGRWSRSRLKSLRNLVDVQQNLEQETLSAAEKMKAIEVVSMGLEGAAAYMKRAISRLDERETGERTVALQERAAKRFADLLEAIAAGEEESEKQPQQQGQPQNGPKQASPQGDTVTLIAQLKVIRTLQLDMKSRVSEIRDRSRSDGELTEADVAELREIAGQQDRIADLVRELTSQFGDPERNE